MEGALGAALTCQGLPKASLEGQGHLRELCSALRFAPAFTYDSRIYVFTKSRNNAVSVKVYEDFRSSNLDCGEE